MSASAITESITFKVISLIFISFLLFSCGAGRSSIPRKKSTSAAQPEEIIGYGKKYLGKPYRYAGRGPHAFDCSGFTAFVFREFGYKLNPSSAGQENQFPAVTRKENLQQGDLVFFEGRRKNGRVGHVGIVTETLSNGAFRFLHASTGFGVIITSSSDDYWSSRYLRGGRVLQENTLAESVEKRARVKSDHRFTPAPSKERPGMIIATEASAAEMVVLVQHDPSKNAPLKEAPLKGEKSPEEKKNDTDYQINNAVIVREDTLKIPEPVLTEREGPTPGNHTVKMGETLYSISRRYDCTVDQLRSWNPQLGEILKVGDLIRVSD